jgi:hypothetical protein
MSFTVGRDSEHLYSVATAQFQYCAIRSANLFTEVSNWIGATSMITFQIDNADFLSSGFLPLKELLRGRLLVRILSSLQDKHLIGRWIKVVEVGDPNHMNDLHGLVPSTVQPFHFHVLVELVSNHPDRPKHGLFDNKVMQFISDEWEAIGNVQSSPGVSTPSSARHICSYLSKYDPNRDAVLRHFGRTCPRIITGNHARPKLGILACGPLGDEKRTPRSRSKTALRALKAPTEQQAIQQAYHLPLQFDASDEAGPVSA